MAWTWIGARTPAKFVNTDQRLRMAHWSPSVFSLEGVIDLSENTWRVLSPAERDKAQTVLLAFEADTMTVPLDGRLEDQARHSCLPEPFRLGYPNKR
jgi:hypothetical protein